MGFDETWVSRQFFEKCSKTKFHENLSSGIRFVPCGKKDGRTDRRDEVNSRFSEFCEGAKTFHNICLQLETICCSYVVRPDFIVMNVTTSIKFELLQWPWWNEAWKHRIQTAVKNFMFCWPCILVQLWVNDQLDAQVRYITRLLL